MRKETLAFDDGARTVYTYDNTGIQIRMTDYAPDGQITCDCVYQKNASGKIIAWQVFDGAGRLICRFEVDYNPQGLESECREYNAQGKLVRRTLRFYDGQGRQIEEGYFDSQGVFTSTSSGPRDIWS